MFRDLDFKVGPISKDGSDLPFEARISYDELSERVNNSRFNIKEVRSEYGYILYYINDNHIATYTPGVLYTYIREAFCQMKG